METRFPFLFFFVSFSKSVILIIKKVKIMINYGYYHVAAATLPVRIGDVAFHTEEMIRTFEKDRFATCNGAVIDQVGDHYAKCSLRIEENHRNAMGAVMGGVYFTLADFAFAVAANWQHMETVSLNSEIAYLGSARGDRLTAEAVCVKDGRTTSYYRIEVKDSEERLIAVVNTTGYKTAR